MKKIFQILIIVSAGLLLNSCYYDELIERPIDVPEPPPEGSEDVSYSLEVQPIWNASCIGCHPNRSQPDLTQGSSYNSLVPAYVTAGNPANSKLYLNLPGNGHPIDVGFEMTAEEDAIIYYWIEQGAKDN